MSCCRAETGPTPRRMSVRYWLPVDYHRSPFQPLSRARNTLSARKEMNRGTTSPMTAASAYASAVRRRCTTCPRCERCLSYSVQRSQSLQSCLVLCYHCTDGGVLGSGVSPLSLSPFPLVMPRPAGTLSCGPGAAVHPCTVGPQAQLHCFDEKPSVQYRQVEHMEVLAG